MSSPEKGCWEQIGVWSPQGPSCPELKTVVHCHSCPVFRAAGAAVFERAPPEDYLAELTDAIAAAPPERNLRTRSAVAFEVGIERFALPPQAVAEIAPLGSTSDQRHSLLHALPHTRDPALLGLVNVGGRLVPCLSLALVLGVQDKQAPPPGAVSQLLLLATPDGPLACPVRRVHGVVRFGAKELEAAPDSLAGAVVLRGIIRVGDAPAALLDAPSLVTALLHRMRA